LSSLANIFILNSIKGSLIGKAFRSKTLRAKCRFIYSRFPGIFLLRPGFYVSPVIYFLPSLLKKMIYYFDISNDKIIKDAELSIKKTEEQCDDS